MNPQDEAQERLLSKQEQLYKEMMGEQALRRQQSLAKELYPCCANRRESGHHPLCRRNK